MYKRQDYNVLVESAEGLENCKKMLKLAKKGKYDGYLLEGMACPDVYKRQSYKGI